MKRGDILVVSMRGQVGKPRPAVIVQNDLFLPGRTIVICPLTSDPIGGQLRPAIEPDPANNLTRRSWVMVDKITAVEMDRIGGRVGMLLDEQMKLVDQRLALFLGLQAT